MTNVQIRLFRRSDLAGVLKLISDIIVNEFKFRLEFNCLDSDLLCIEEHYNKSDGGCFWVAEETVDKRIIATAGIRNLKQYASTCELKRMYVLKEYRRLGIGGKMLDIAIDFAKRIGYSRIVLDSSKYLEAARALYLKNGFVDIARYNDNHRADIFMEKRLR
jgi:GNAT superfamily N-acetyltransferase